MYLIKNFYIVIFTIFLQSSLINCANILGLFTSYSPSHVIIHMSVMKALAEKGHNITVVSIKQPTVTHPAIKHVIIPPSKEQDRDLERGMKIMASGKHTLFSFLKNLLTSMDVTISMQVDIIKDERFLKLYNQKFDLLIMGYIMNDYQLGVAAKFNCPIILNWPMSPMLLVNDFMGNPEEIEYVPSMNVPLKVGEVMGFQKRMQNFISHGIFRAFRFIVTYRMRSYYHGLFPGDNFPTYDEMKKNVSLLFCNSHFSEGIIRPNVPAVIEIGGIQIKDKPDDLPEDLADFLNKSKANGAILFALGSNLKGNNIQPEIVQIIFKTLSSLKQNIIWKWEDLENLPGKSPNILYKKWLPQDDILAHPNLKLFITHAGKGGIAEAQYHVVPMVALPVYADQAANADKMVVSGYGQQLEMQTLEEKEFRAAILEVLENPKYKENIQRFSQLYRDRPLTAKQSVVYWTEYVLRHHGAKHMQSPLVHLNFLQSYSFDIIGALLLITYITLKLLKTLLVFVWKKLCEKVKSKSNKIKKQ